MRLGPKVGEVADDWPWLRPRRQREAALSGVGGGPPAPEEEEETEETCENGCACEDDHDVWIVVVLDLNLHVNLG